MSIKLSDSIRVGQQKPLEDKYFNELVPYTSTTQVNTLLPKAIRHIGLTVNINKEEYWYKDGIEDANLVLKVPNIDTFNLKNQEQDDRLENLEGENVAQYDIIHDLFSELQSERTRNDIQDSALNNLEGINYTWSPTNRTLTLFDRGGNQLSQVSLVSLDNEGTDLRYNASTLSLELYNANNELLDSIPVSSFVGSVGTQLQLNSNELQLKDNQGTILATVTFEVNNINGLQTILNNKQDRLQNVTGNIGVGKTDVSATEKLDVNGTVKANGFKTPTGTATQALTANGDTFDLNTKADLVGGKIPASQLPAYVDDVLEFANLASFPATGESGKIYIAIDTNITYRWSGSGYVGISSSLALGETSSTAYRGDRGKTAYDHSQATGNPHNTKVEELTDVSGDATTIIDTDVILKKETGGLWKKITFANFKNWFTNELAKKINIGVDTIFNFKNISAMPLTDFRNIIPNIETIYFTEEQNSTGWQQIRYPLNLAMGVNGLSETPVMLPVEDIELDSDSTFNLINVENIKINGIFEKDFVIINFSTGVYIGNVTPNQWFKLILRVNGVQVAVSPAFFHVEPYGTHEEISHSFALNVTAEMVTHGATLHIKKSDGTITFAHPTITVVRVHKSINANL